MTTLITTNSRPAAASQLGQLLRQGLSPLAAAAWKAKPAPQSTAGRRALPLAPHHIAIAPGGHRLWAADRLLPEVAALIQGLERLMETVAFCSEQRVQRLTFLALPSDHHALEPCERSVGSGGYWRPALMRAAWALSLWERV